MSFAIRTPRVLKSVPARLTFWYVWTLGAALAVFAVFVFVMRAGTLHRELDAALAVDAHRLAEDLRPVLLGLDVPGALAGDPRVEQAPVVVREVPDLVLFRSRRFPQLDLTAERRVISAARDGVPLLSVEDRSHVVVRVATVIIDRPGTESLAIQMAASTAPIQHILGQLAGAMILGILLVLALAGYGSTFTARRALAPVDEIVRRVRHIQANRLGDRLDIQGGSDELDQLVATLNEMLDRIEASFRSVRRFAADASHELQTPIAAMRAALEMCLRKNRSEADYQVMAADLLAEIERLSTLIRDLRLLALADAGQLVAAPQPVDLAAVATECCEIARAIAEGKQIRVETVVEDRPVVRGSDLHLRRVVLNLTDNAIRYSPAGSTVHVSVARVDGRAVLTVRDQGCGIDPSDLPHIFEPFYRDRKSVV